MTLTKLTHEDGKRTTLGVFQGARSLATRTLKRGRGNLTRPLHGLAHLEVALSTEHFGGILDRGEFAPERQDEAHAAWDVAEHRHGQIVHEWMVNLKWARLVVETQDETVVVSSEQVASGMLRDAAVAPEWKQSFELCSQGCTMSRRGQDKPYRPRHA